MTQPPLFEPPAPVVTKGRRRRSPPPERTPAPVWDGPKPWDPIDEADRDLGYQYPYVTPRRAYEIRIGH